MQIEELLLLEPDSSETVGQLRNQNMSMAAVDLGMFSEYEIRQKRCR